MIETRFFSSKQLIDNYSGSKTVDLFFRADAVRKSASDRYYVKPICAKVDGARRDDIDFNFNLNLSTFELLKMHPTYVFWVVSVDGKELKQFVTRKGETFEYFATATKFVTNAKSISTLKEIELEKASVIGYEGEL